MFERLGRMAERAAVSVSRRQFLGRLGAGLAAAAGGLMAQRALAGSSKNIYCDPNYSDAACGGQYVGSSCYRGRCTASATLASNVAACYCRSKFRPF